MKAYAYLSRVFHLDRQIECKLEQIESLRSLTQRVTAAYSSDKVSHSGGGAPSAMEKAIIRLMEAQEELSGQIAALVETKKETQQTISRVKNERLRLLLEKRYLCCMTWEALAVDMDCSYRWLMSLHRDALDAVDKLIGNEPEENKKRQLRKTS